MRFLLITLGSHGDVHPFVGLSQRLAERGHDVILATNAYFRGLCERDGVSFKPVGTRDQFVRMIDNPDVWHPRRGGPAVMSAAAESARILFRLVCENADEDTVVVGSSLAMGALSAAELRGLRYATVHLSPLCIRSSVEMPRLPGVIGLNWMPMWMRRKFWEGADRWFIDPAIVPPLNALRAEVGLPPVTRVMNGWWSAPMLTIGLWPGWYARPQPDWPAQVRLTGFPLYDEADVTPLSDELLRWLDAGEKPIAFTPGSAMRFGRRFFEQAIEASRRLGRRALLLTRHPEQLPPSLPDNVRYEPFAPFGALLPRCAAVVHHGGIGSVAQALRAGTPQLVMAMSHDQPDNGARVARLGAGDWLSARRFNARRVARLLRRLITDPQIANACRQTAQRFVGVDALGQTCDVLESLAARPRPTTSNRGG
jgi:UDP:flavonoid glycosyltransferase YjiC (YdhE family)